MLKDMGKALDWINKVNRTKKSQVLKIKFGPTLYTLICVHPDTLRTVLKNGIWGMCKYENIKKNYLTYRFQIQSRIR